MLSPEQVEDIREKAYVGQPVNFNNICYIYPLTIEEIIAVGRYNYNSMLGLLTLKEAQIKSIIKEKTGNSPNIENIEPLSYLLQSAEKEDMILLELQAAFSTFIKEDILLLPQINSVLVGNPKEKRLITKDNFQDFQNILLLQNRKRIPEPIPPNETPFERKMRLNRELVAEAKRKKAEKEGGKQSDSLVDLLEIAEAFDIDYRNRTLFALKGIVQRKRAKEKWDQDIEMLCAGADSEKLKTKYWGESSEE